MNHSIDLQVRQKINQINPDFLTLFDVYKQLTHEESRKQFRNTINMIDVGGSVCRSELDILREIYKNTPDDKSRQIIRRYAADFIYLITIGAHANYWREEFEL